MGASRRRSCRAADGFGPSSRLGRVSPISFARGVPSRDCLPVAELAVAALAAEPGADGSDAFLYAIPTFQNPSGRSLSLERRHRLVELARERDLLVIEDDPYGLVRFEGEREPTVFELAAGDGVVYASS